MHEFELWGISKRTIWGRGEGMANKGDHPERRETNTECQTLSVSLNEGDGRSPKYC
jgi:hypothetical protein